VNLSRSDVLQRLAVAGRELDTRRVDAWSTKGVRPRGFPVAIRLRFVQLPLGRAWREEDVERFAARLQAAGELVAAGRVREVEGLPEAEVMAVLDRLSGLERLSEPVGDTAGDEPVRLSRPRQQTYPPLRTNGRRRGSAAGGSGAVPVPA